MRETTKVAKQGQHRRWVSVGLATVLALAMTAMLLAIMTQAASSGWFFRIQRNLSSTDDRWSVYPDVAADADGDPLVAVWIEEYDYLAGSGYLGHVRMRAASASSGGWADTTNVYYGNSSACASYRAAVAITGTTAHVAYIVNKPCGGPEYTEVRHTTCDLSGGMWLCGGSEIVTSTQVVSSYVTTVDVAVDAVGNPRIVWTQYYESPPGTNNWYGTIYYRGKEGGYWGDIETVYNSGDSGNPAIAWANGYDHIVWEYQDTPGGVVEQIRYKRRDSSSGTWLARTLFDYQADITEPGYYPPGNPDVAAGGERVCAVWDIRYDDAVPPTYPETYAVVYRYSSDDGVNFAPLYQVHPDYNPGHANLAHYDPIDNSLVGRLQPSIALGDDYLPGVVWHGASQETGDLPGVYYSFILSDTGKWLTPTVLLSDWADNGVGAVGVAMAKEDDETPFMHIVYMRKWHALNWDVHYGSGSEVLPDYPTIYFPLMTR
jgi:hypothetical protein